MRLRIRTKQVKLRVTPSEHVWLKRESAQTGETITDILLRRAGIPKDYKDPSDYSNVPLLPFKEKGKEKHGASM